MKRPTTMAATMDLMNVLLERKPSDLKLGYRTVLTIIAERNSSTTTRKYFQLPRSLLFSLSLMISSVNDETKPAADGIGKPRKSLVAALLPMALKQLKRARRNAPQSK